MTFLTRATLLLLVLMSAACDQPPQTSSTAAVDAVVASAPEPYVERGDLPALRQHGVLRLLAPTFDEDPSLPRDGMPLASYRETAEAFARSLDLDSGRGLCCPVTGTTQWSR